MSPIMVFMTTAGKPEAQRIAKALIKEKLAACVTLQPGLQSVYWWKNKIESASECWLIAKTERRLFGRLEQRVKSLHSYTVPEIIAIPVIQGHQPYLRWMKDVLRRK